MGSVGRLSQCGNAGRTRRMSGYPLFTGTTRCVPRLYRRFRLWMPSTYVLLMLMSYVIHAHLVCLQNVALDCSHIKYHLDISCFSFSIIESFSVFIDFNTKSFAFYAWNVIHRRHFQQCTSWSPFNSSCDVRNKRRIKYCAFELAKITSRYSVIKPSAICFACMMSRWCVPWF